MPVTLDELHDAQNLDRAALVKILAENYPLVHRMTCAMVGRERVARKLIRQIMTQSLRALANWRDDGAPDRWFPHHTIIEIRKEKAPIPKPADDLLIEPEDRSKTAYVAFIRAMRSLPEQQREAFILHVGEQWEVRKLSIAMDCSMSAADTHLTAASSTLRKVCGAEYGLYVDRMMIIYHSLSPREDLSVPFTGKLARSYVWPRKLWRIINPILALSILAALIYYGWRLYRLIDI
jgi:DNA-directed RNA polymerase specialized sigma24 family protein